MDDVDDVGVTGEEELSSLETIQAELQNPEMPVVKGKLASGAKYRVGC